MELFTFDGAYVERLRAGDPQTEQHFVAYFSTLLQLKLRARYLSREAVDDLRQETFARVLTAVKRKGELRQPDRLGPFVNSVCNNVLQEFYRASSRTQPLEEDPPPIADKAINLEGFLITEQVRQVVREVLDELPERDRRILQAIFFQEKEKDEVCRDFAVDRDYLRVLLHRAKERFRVEFEKHKA